MTIYTTIETGEDSSLAGLEQLEDGSTLVDISEDSEQDYVAATPLEVSTHYTNLVDELDEDVLRELGQIVITNFEEDKATREEWESTLEKGLQLLGLEVRESNEPFQGACSAQHPLLIESAVKFQSKASLELLPSKGPVETTVLGTKNAEKEKQALRVKNHMNYQITEEMTEYYPDTERLLFTTALLGSAFKKTYYDAHKERPVSEYIPADEFIVSNSVSDLHRAECYTHVLEKTQNQLNADFAKGLYKKPNEGLSFSPSQKDHTLTASGMEEIGMVVDLSEHKDKYTLLEQHIEIFIDELETDPTRKEYQVASPYIITVEKETGAVIGIRRNWRPKDDDKRSKIVKFTHYGFVPGFGYYNYGFIHLLGNIQLSLTAALRSLIDSGQFANLQGGFKLKGVRISGDQDPISPGQFKDIEAGIQDISKAIYPLPFKEPSTVLFNMLNWLDGKGQKFADSTEQVIADSTNQGPVGTTLALLDASTKFFSAIHKRLHKAQKHELNLIAQINSETLKENTLYNLRNEEMKVSREDYNMFVDVVPVSDPNISSNAHRMTKAQVLLDMAIKTPGVHDMREVMKRVYINMDYGDVEKLLPPPEEAVRGEPIEDIQKAIKGAPIKAFDGQDHEAHIAIKRAFLSDPTTGGSQFMQAAAKSIQANIQEHMLLQFMSESNALAAQQGTDLAKATEQLAQMKIQQLQEQQKASQTQNNAVLTLAQAEVLDKENDARKIAFDAQYKTAELELKKEELELSKLKAIGDLEGTQAKLQNNVDKIVVTKTLEAMIKELNNRVTKNNIDKKE